MLLRNFLRDKRGNIALMFGLMLLPMLALVGAALDYTRAADQSSRIQAAVDATALNLAKLPTSTTATDFQAAGDAAVRAYITNAAIASALTVTATRNGSAVQITATSAMPARFVTIVGINSVPIGATSTADWGNTRLRVAMALDVTGSMSQSSKLTSLQTAATNMLTQLQNSAKVDGDVYASIVPFAKDVNVGPSNSAATWLKFSGSADTWDENNGSCNVSYTAPAPGTSKKSACEASSVCSNTTYTTQASCTGAGTCSNSSYSTQSSCTGAGTCSKSGSTTQSTCTATGTCSNASYTTQSTCVNQCSISGTTQPNCNSTCSNTNYTTQSNCTTHGTCTKSGRPTQTDMTSSQCGGGYTFNAYSWTTRTWMTMTWTPATWTPYTWTPYIWTVAVWTPASHSTWTGCVMDRDQSYDATNTAPGAASATLFPAEQYANCPVQLMGLSYDWTALKAEVNSLTAQGGTNQAIGLAWAFQSLTASPMTVPALDPAYNYKQAIILLSDGLNTQDRFYGDGTTYSSQVDDRQKILCDNVKAAGISIYTVQVNTDSEPTSTVLQYCASDSSKFFLLTSSSQIVTTFAQIATDLTTLRLTH